MELCAGAYYRNGLGQVVRIVGTVPSSSRWYAKGYRFVDSCGSFYLADGTMDTWLWKSLELASVVAIEDVGDAEIRRIQDCSPELLARVQKGRAKSAAEPNQPSQALPDPEPRTEIQQPSRLKAHHRSAAARRDSGDQSVPVAMSSQTLRMFNDGARATLQTWDVASMPTYQAYFETAGKAFRDASGKLHPEIRNSAGQISEKAKIRKVRLSPAKVTNIAFEVASILVAQEHLARIDRNLDEIATNLGDLKSSVLDEIAAPVRVAASSLCRLSRSGATDLPSEVIRAWLLDLRKSRERLLALVELALGKVEAVPGRHAGVKPSFLRTAMALSGEANSLIEILMTCDALIDRYWRVNDEGWAMDGVDTTIPGRLAARLHDLEREFIGGLLINDAFILENEIEYQLFPELGRTRNLIDAHHRSEQARDLLQVLGNGQELVLAMQDDCLVGIEKILPAVGQDRDNSTHLPE